MYKKKNFIPAFSLLHLKRINHRGEDRGCWERAFILASSVCVGGGWRGLGGRGVGVGVLDARMPPWGSLVVVVGGGDCGGGGVEGAAR